MLKNLISEPAAGYTHLTQSRTCVLTCHGVDAWRRGLPVGRDWHGHDWEGFGHGGQGERHADRGHAGGREGNHGGQGDVIHDQRVVAMVKRTKVTTDTESFLWRERGGGEEEKSLKGRFYR